MSFIEVRARLFESYGRGDYREALDAIEHYHPSNKDEETQVGFWRMCLMSRLGMLEEACSVFSEYLDKGSWWGSPLLADPDLDAVRGLATWKRLVEVSLSRAEESKREQTPPIDIVPFGETQGTLVLLHGAGEQPSSLAEQCRSALAIGRRLLGLCGEAYSSNGRFGWSDVDGEIRAIRQLKQAALPERPILLGYSQGAGLAGHLGWSGKYPCKGLLLFAPTFRIRGMPLSHPGVVPVKTYLHVGTEDPSLEDARQVARRLQERGAAVRLVERPHLGHDLPPDMDQVLPEAIEWIEEII